MEPTDWLEHSPNGRLQESALHRLAAKIGGPVPADYLEMLKEFNGGIPQKRRLPFYNEVNEEEDETEFVCFYPVTDDAVDHKRDLQRFYSSVLETKETVLDMNHPNNGFIPIGQDCAGNLICLRHAGENTGKVFFLDHDYEEFYRHSDSLKEFIASLQELGDWE